MSTPYTYVPRTEQQLEKRSNQSASKFVNVIQEEFNTYAPKKDANAIRILPPTWEMPEHYGYDVWVHFDVGPNHGTVVCLSQMKRQPCPICEFQAKIEAAGREDASDYKPKRRVLVWLVDRKLEQEKKSTEDNPQAWTMPWTVDRDISKICKDRETGQLYQIDHPEVGYDIFFDKTGEKDLTKYTGFSIARRESSVSPVYMKFIIEHPLPTILIWREYAEVKFLFEGEAVDAKQSAETVPVPPTNGAYTSVPVAVPLPPVPMPAPAPIAPAPVAVMPPPPPPAPLPPQPPKAFVSEWVTGSSCPACGQQQFTTPDGVTCASGHEQKRLPFAPPPAPLPPPQPIAIPAASSAIDERAAAVRARFNTGSK